MGLFGNLFKSEFENGLKGLLVKNFLKRMKKKDRSG